jgi:assimilatory nitrate reductase catalytic subunit
MGFAGFDYRSAAEVFREYAALTAFENDGERILDLGALADLSDADYDALEPVQWPLPKGAPRGRARLFADGGYASSGGRANFVAPATPALATQVTSELPLRLNTGRIRDQWHTMTRTGASPRLARHIQEPFVEISPRDAVRFGVADGGFARVSTAYGACALRASVTDRQPPGQIFAPIHWTDETAAQARVGALVAPFVDPFSGQPELKATPATIAPVNYARQGFILSRAPLALGERMWWTRVAIAGGFAYRIAGDMTDAAFAAFLDPFITSGDVIDLADETRGVFRGAAFVGDRADLVWSLSAAPCVFDAEAELFARDRLDGKDRLALLTRHAASDACANGALVCACFSVGEKPIEAMIAKGCRSVGEIGAVLRAGTNCGSCIPEIKRMINRAPVS